MADPDPSGSPPSPAPVPHIDPFRDDPPLARVVRRLDGYLGLAEQVVLVGLGLFLVVVALLWLATEHLAAKPLENARADMVYTVYLMAMIGGAFAAHHRRLLAMDVINRMVGARARAALRLLTTLFALAVTAVFFWYSFDLFLDLRAVKDPQHWMPASAAKGAMAIGAALIMVHLLAQVLIDVAYLAAGKLPPEPEMGAV